MPKIWIIVPAAFIAVAISMGFITGRMVAEHGFRSLVPGILAAVIPATLGLAAAIRGGTIIGREEKVKELERERPHGAAPIAD